LSLDKASQYFEIKSKLLIKSFNEPKIEFGLEIEARGFLEI